MFTFQKFIFLGALTLAIAWGGGVNDSRTSTATVVRSVASGSSAKKEAPPLVALETPAVVAESAPAASATVRGAFDVKETPITNNERLRSTAFEAEIGATRAMRNHETVPNGKQGLPSLAPRDAPTTPAALRAFANPFGAAFYRHRSTALPPLTAQAALVADLETGEIYFEFNADRRWPLASLTKLMTAVVVLEKMKRDAEIIFAPDDFAGRNASPSSYFKAGDTFSVSKLFDALLVASSNEAAEALARQYGRANFIAEMNARGQSWQLSHTHFSDPSGLSAANQSTARDLLRFAARVRETHPEVFDATLKPSARIAEEATGRVLTLRNTNLFTKRPWFLGGKTGYTDEALGNLLTVFSYERRPVLIVVLGTSDRFGETEALKNWFTNDFTASPMP